MHIELLFYVIIVFHMCFYYRYSGSTHSNGKDHIRFEF